MEQKIIRMCLLLPTFYNADFPLTETEIYGEYIPSLGHEIDWITPCLKKPKLIQIILEKLVYTLFFTLISIQFSH